MQDIFKDQFLQSCKSGSVEEVRRFVTNNGVDINSCDDDGNTGLHFAAEGKCIDVIRYLLGQDVDLNAKNTKGRTGLHVACESGSKEIILILLMAGSDPEIADQDKQKAGQDNIDIKSFMNNIIPEKEAFNVLPKEAKARLCEIFSEIDYDFQKVIDYEKAKKFNRFIDDSLNMSIIEKDAKDFIKWTALCNKEAANQDEWLFAFSKLYATDKPGYEKFLDDYTMAVTKKGALKNFDIDMEQPI